MPLTNFKGIALSYTKYLDGSAQVCLVREVGSNGGMQDGYTFDAYRLQHRPDEKQIVLSPEGIDTVQVGRGKTVGFQTGLIGQA
jgi:hypothetical protein